MHKHEQDFCTALKKWLHYNMHETVFIEAKISVGDAPFNYKSGFKEHQIPTLQTIKHGSFGYKISDMDRMIKPFDLLHAYKAKSFIALHWIRPRNKVFYLIEVDDIKAEIDKGNKSLTEERAREIAYLTGELK
jgi:hypothetical protein